MIMHFYWVRDWVRQGQFLVYWKKGSLNRTDYFTKHHPASHHTLICAQYLHSPLSSAHHPNYYACLDSDDATVTTCPCGTATTVHWPPASGGEGVLIPASSTPCKRSADQTSVTTRLGISRYTGNHAPMTAIE